MHTQWSARLLTLHFRVDTIVTKVHIYTDERHDMLRRTVMCGLNVSCDAKRYNLQFFIFSCINCRIHGLCPGRLVGSISDATQCHLRCVGWGGCMCIHGHGQCCCATGAPLCGEQVHTSLMQQTPALKFGICGWCILFARYARRWFVLYSVSADWTRAV